MRAINYMQNVFDIHMVKNSDATEFMKIASLVKYMCYLSVADELSEAAKKIGVDGEWLKHWDATQNEHIDRFYSQMRFPVLNPTGGVCGGHCVIPVSKFYVEDERFPAGLAFIAYSKYTDLQVLQHLQDGKDRQGHDSRKL